MRKINLDIERDYENLKKIDDSTRLSQKKFYWATSLPSDQHRARVLEYIKGMTVLEIGCSDGGAAEEYTVNCVKYVGIDISNIAIGLAKSRNLENAEFICTDAHELPFDNGSFDIVIVTALLHHLDVPSALKEIHRVLKSGGLFIFLEPLGINPLYKLYRSRTPEARTVDERPLLINDLNLLKHVFHIDKITYFGFFSLISAFIKVSSLRKLLTILDGLVLRGPFKFLAWQFCGVARKVD